MSIHAVTGSGGYLGRFITARLLAQDHLVRTLTGHPKRPLPFTEPIEVRPFDFADPHRLVEHLRGVDTLFNTYWVRFERGQVTYSQAVANSQNLIAAAVEAGVRRFVHTSITNPDADSELPYFRGKAIIEETLRASGMSYAIVRPTVLFGGPDILLNNIAWLLRRFPLFGVFGRGDYRMQPVHVDDVAALMVELAGSDQDTTVDAVGPEVYTYAELVRSLARHIGRPARLVSISPALGVALSAIIGRLLGDVVITRQEIDGLMAELLVSHGPSTCPTRLSAWLPEHAAELGGRYASELARHFDTGHGSRLATHNERTPAPSSAK